MSGNNLALARVWRGGKGVGNINKVALRRARLVLDGWPFAGTPYWYGISHIRQLSLLPSAGW